MNEKELAVLELLNSMQSPRSWERISLAYAKVFPNEEHWDGVGDAEGYHSVADAALLTLLPEEIRIAFDRVEKWYA